MSTRDDALRAIRALDPPCEREPLALAAIEVITKQSPEGLAVLASYLRTPEFLRRLDDVDNPQRKTYFLGRVFAAMEQHPSEATRDLCIAAAESPEFCADPIRLNYLLPALAAVRPMTQAAAAVFRRTNSEGYFPVNAPLMTRNESPIALRLFEEMIRNPQVDPESRIDALRHSVLPRRTELPILATAERLLSGGLEPEVEIGLIETLFDYREKPWFGPVRVPPAPRPWETASDEACQRALALAQAALARSDLPGETRQAVQASVNEIEQLLESRRK
jgi:hypothetical protein